MFSFHLEGVHVLKFEVFPNFFQGLADFLHLCDTENTSLLLFRVFSNHTNQHSSASMNPDLLPVRSNDANVTGRNGRQALLALRLQQFPHVVHEHLHLGYVEERRTVGLTLVNTSDPVEDDGEIPCGIRLQGQQVRE